MRKPCNNCHQPYKAWFASTEPLRKKLRKLLGDSQKLKTLLDVLLNEDEMQALLDAVERLKVRSYRAGHRAGQGRTAGLHIRATDEPRVRRWEVKVRSK